LSGGINLFAYATLNPINAIDPYGLAWLQKRPLDIFYLRSKDPTGKLKHTRFIFDDGSESGYYGDSRVKNDPASEKLKSKYKNVGEYLQDDILKKAVSNVKPKWDYSKDSIVNEYKLTDWFGPSHNCQDYTDAVLKEYYRLKREMEESSLCE